MDPCAGLLPVGDRWVARAKFELGRSLREHSLLMALIVSYVRVLGYMAQKVDADADAAPGSAPGSARGAGAGAQALGAAT